jgi:fermentation-respiration switch protein FrsA (DUF1100 family)
LRLLALILAIAVAWKLLVLWVVGAAERFYFLLPPVTATAYLLLVPDAWRSLRPYLRRALVCFLFLAVVLTLLRLTMLYVIFTKIGFFLPVPRVAEHAVCLYLSASLCLMVFLILGLLRGVGRWIDQRLYGPCPEPVPARRLLRNNLPVLLLLPLCFPYLLAAMYVHRPKGANVASPTVMTGRTSADVSLTTRDGVALCGWFLPVKEGTSSRTVVMCHGLGGVRSDVLNSFAVADALEANILVFDFRGHGDSDGHTVSFGCQEKWDVVAAVAYLREQRPQQARQIVGYGQSMGAATLALAAPEIEPPLDAVILDSAFASALDLTDTVLGTIPGPVRNAILVPGVPLASLHAGCDLRTARPIDVIGRVRAPLLLIHATGDKLIPVENSRRLYEQAQEPKSLWLTDTGDHCSSFLANAEYLRRCRALLPR